MLVISRKKDQSIKIAGGIRVTVLKVRGDQVKLGIEAPKQVKILRDELEPLEDPGKRTAA